MVLNTDSHSAERLSCPVVLTVWLRYDSKMRQHQVGIGSNKGQEEGSGWIVGGWRSSGTRRNHLLSFGCVSLFDYVYRYNRE